MQIYQEAEEIKSDLLRWRRELHRIPETGMDLPNTKAYIQKQLDEMGISYELPGDGTCITGVLGAGKECLLLRSDMDALPVQEETGLEFASGNGCMHACGHDMHAAVLLGALKLLKRHETELLQQIKFLFQPGEEIFSGAKAAIENGILDNPRVDRAFAMHVASPLPAGCIGYGEHAMAAVYGFKIKLKGKGGHGSMPEVCIDPINTGVHIYLALQELIARECPASQEAVLTIGEFSAGNTSNVIPETAVLQGTLRTFDREITELMIERISETAKGIAAVYRTGIEIETLSKVPAVRCDTDMNAKMKAALEEIKPDLKILSIFHAMGSEDFAFISEKVPSTYLMLGAAVNDKEKIYPQHNPKVQFNEDALPVGVAGYVCAAMTLR